MTRGRFDRDRLPSSPTYFTSIGMKLVGRGAWRTAVCPFHNDTRPSLRVHFMEGAFKCMACGAHGGDILAFHQQRTGVGFTQAARELGAWVMR